MMWATQSIITKKIHNHVNMYDFFIFVYIAVGILCVPYLFYKKPDLKQLRSHGGYILLWGLTTFFAAIIFFYCIAKNPSGVSATVCIQNTLTFVLVVLMSYVILGETVSFRQLVGIVLSLIAIYLLS